MDAMPPCRNEHMDALLMKRWKLQLQADEPENGDNSGSDGWITSRREHDAEAFGL